MIVAIGRISHETNTFSKVKTRLGDYDPCYGEKIFNMYEGTRTELGGFIDVLKKEGFDILPTLAASATPSGPTVLEDFNFMIGEILKRLKEVKLDGVLLSLHGAMVADGVSDAEGTLLNAIKRSLGDSIPVICTLDLHALISDLILANVDAVFGFDTNPHVDMYERGVEAAKIMVSTLRREIKPVTAFKKLPMMPPTINQRTTEGPMVKLFKEARKMEELKGVINVSVFGGFPYADVPRVGSSVVVVADGDVELAKRLSAELGEQFWNLRNEFLKELTPVNVAVQRAMDAVDGPVILADVADNPGGGAPGDGTVILRELINRGAKNVGVAVIKDPEALQKMIEVGVRETLKLTIGGKSDKLHGEPIEVTGKVRTITDGIFIHKAGRVGLRVDVGKTAVLDVDGIEIIVAERSHAPNDPEIFRRNGIDPTEKKILVLKSRGHFRAAYESFCKEVIEVDTPGITSPNLKLFKYANIPRPIWPIDDI